MKRTTKVLVTTVAVIGLGIASIPMVSAHGGFNRSGGCDSYGGPQQWQQSQRGGGPMMQRGFKGQFGSGMEQFMQQRLDQAKYHLRITKEQEPAWQKFTDTIAKKVTFMRDHKQQRGAQQTVTERVQNMRDKAEQMGELAGAVESLYKTLTPEQQKIADQIRPMGRRGF
ncbi:MAG: Spy/CpxP family protein refolding chaperone [Gammaproteobacteria bacterium]|nr:Spy/CpxP family protein refolding chaperone [Gammaproteobacteria bacterium]